MAMLRAGKVIGAMTNWYMIAIEKMEKAISLDGYMFCGKEEHFPVSSLREVLADYMDGYFEMGYQDGEKILRGNSAFRARSLALCACKVWYRIWGRLRLCKVSVRAA